MTIWRARALAAGALLFVVAGGVVCYKPNIQDGGLLCGPARACPDGFSCRADGTCQKGPAAPCQPGAPHLAQICTPAEGNDCDPICQSRCDCGRCNLVGVELKCTPPGTVQTGDTCTTGDNDNCAPGNICLKDCDGKIARCFRFCATDLTSDEGECKGQLCDVPVNGPGDAGTPYFVCEPPAKACNPVGDSGDCRDPALGCYITSTGVTACDCKGAAGSRGACGTYNSCTPGYRCISISGGTKCYQTCAVNAPVPDCTAPEVCKQAPGSPNYGYCDLP
jgi:hypothetical protein